MILTLKRVLLSWIDPVVKVDKLDDLRQARLIAAILLVLLSISLPWEIFSVLSWGFRSVDPFIIPMVFIFAFLYLMARHGKVDLASIVLIGMLTLGSAALLRTESGAAGAVTYFYLLGTISLAGFLVPFRIALGIVVLCVGIAAANVVSLEYVISNEPYFVALALLLSISCILVLGAWHRDGMERDRMSMLAASEAQKAAMLAAMPDALFRFDHLGVCLEARPSKGVSHSLADRSPVGRKMSEVAPFSSCGDLSRLFSRVLETGIGEELVCRIDGNNPPLAFELRFAGAQGKQILALVRDITDRIQAEEQLGSAEERYRHVSSMISDYVYVARLQPGGDWRFEWSLEEFQQLTGHSESEGSPELGRLPIHPDDLPIWYARCDRLSNALETREEFRIVRSDGATLWLRDFGRPVVDELTGCVTRVFGAIQDITENKRAEAQEAALLAEIQQRKSELEEFTKQLAAVQEAERKQLADNLHDLNGRNLTSLTYTLDKAQNCLSDAGCDPAEVSELIADGIDLARDTLQRTRSIMAELRPPMLDEFGLVDALEHYCTLFERRSDLHLNRAFPEHYARRPIDVEDVLFRIVQESLTNVKKHANATAVSILLSCDSGCLSLTIQDNGIGFESTTRRFADGYGHWGLMIMRERVESIGGSLSVTSSPGAGTLIQVEVDT